MLFPFLLVGKIHNVFIFQLWDAIFFFKSNNSKASVGLNLATLQDCSGRRGFHAVFCG